MFSCDCSSVIWLRFCAVVCSSFKVLGRFRRDRLDDIEHLGDRFAEVGDTFAREGLSIVARPEVSLPCGKVDRGFAEQAERDQARLRVFVDDRVLVDAHVDARLVFRLRVRAGVGVAVRRRRADRIGGGFRALALLPGKPAN